MIKTDIDQVDVAEITIKNVLSVLYCSRIGRVINFYPEKYTADVEIMQVFENQSENFIPTILPDVPLIFAGNGTAGIVPPNPVGKNVLLIVNDRNIDNFLLTGERYLPDNARMHSFADCVAILTLNSYIDTPPMYDENALTMYNGTQFAKIFNDSIELYAEKIKLYNASTTLLTLINSLIDTIKGITTAGTSAAQSVDAASQQALENLKTSFGELLQ